MAPPTLGALLWRTPGVALAGWSACARHRFEGRSEAPGRWTGSPGPRLLVRRAAFDEVGGFRSPFFMYFEEGRPGPAPRRAGGWETRVRAGRGGAAPPQLSADQGPGGQGTATTTEQHAGRRALLGAHGGPTPAPQRRSPSSGPRGPSTGPARPGPGPALPRPHPLALRPEATACAGASGSSAGSTRRIEGGRPGPPGWPGSWSLRGHTVQVVTTSCTCPPTSPARRPGRPTTRSARDTALGLAPLRPAGAPPGPRGAAGTCCTSSTSRGPSSCGGRSTSSFRIGRRAAEAQAPAGGGDHLPRPAGAVPFPKAGRLGRGRHLARSCQGIIAAEGDDLRHAAGVDGSTQTAPRDPPGAPGQRPGRAAPRRGSSGEARRARLGLAPGQLPRSGTSDLVNRTKGVDVLVQALALLVAGGRDAHLLMIGDPLGSSDPTNREYLEGVRRQVAQAGLEGRVRWTGFCDPPQVAGWLRCLDVCALPFSEGASLRAPASRPPGPTACPRSPPPGPARRPGPRAAPRRSRPPWRSPAPGRGPGRPPGLPSPAPGAGRGRTAAGPPHVLGAVAGETLDLYRAALALTRGARGTRGAGAPAPGQQTEQGAPLGAVEDPRPAGTGPGRRPPRPRPGAGAGRWPPAGRLWPARARKSPATRVAGKGRRASPRAAPTGRRPRRASRKGHQQHHLGDDRDPRAAT